MLVPEDLFYTKDHEWARIEGDVAYVGITDFAQSELGDIVFLDVPTVGEMLSAGENTFLFFGIMGVPPDIQVHCVRL